MNRGVAQILIVCLVLSVAYVCSFAQDKAPVIEIPFDFYRNEIILQVKGDGKGPFNMMLDTGTDPSAVDLTTARELGLEDDFNRARVTTAVGFNGVSENRQGQVNNITIGEISLDAPAVVFFGKGNTDLIPSESIEKTIYLIRGEKGDAGSRFGIALPSGDEGVESRRQEKFPAIPVRFHVSTHD